MAKLIVLDRDGVINEDSPNYIRSPAEWTPLPGSLEALAQLNNLGYTVVVATNQSGVGRGYFSLETLEEIHAKMMHLVRDAGGDLAAIFCCTHVPEDGCGCRKPQPGLLLRAAKQFKVSPGELTMVGDSFRDILAARNCGAQAIFLRSSDKGRDLFLAEEMGVPVCDNLLAAVTYLSMD